MSDYCEGGIKHFRHHMPLQMRFNDIDMLGHLNNSVYLTFMDLAKTRYFQAALGDKLRWGEIGVVIVNINCDFFEPSYFNEPLQVWTAITHIGHRSFTIEQRIVNPGTGHTKCIGRTTLAGFDPATAAGAPLDENLVRAAVTFEQRPNLHDDKLGK